MLSVWIVAFGCLLWLSLGSRAQFLEPDCGTTINISKTAYRIRAGQAAGIGSNPWMAYLHNNSILVCAGSLITNRFVLTAAHCLYYGEIKSVRLGDYNLLTRIDCRDHICLPPHEEYGVQLSYFHNNYGVAPGGSYDIGLIKLDRTVKYKVHIRPICLLRNPDQAAQSPSYQATGWGKIDLKNYASILQTVTLYKLKPHDCERFFQIPMQWGQFCAGNLKGDTCSGDSGGPLMHQMSKNHTIRTIQFGIVSYGHSSCHGPAIYTDVLAHTNWILNAVRCLGNYAV